MSAESLAELCQIFDPKTTIDSCVLLIETILTHYAIRLGVASFESYGAQQSDGRPLQTDVTR